MHKVICFNTPVGKYYVESEDGADMKSQIKTFYENSGDLKIWATCCKSGKYFCLSQKILSNSAIEVFEIDDLRNLP